MVTCEGLQVLLPQQVFFLVMQRTEELPACLTVQVLVSMPLWTERGSEQGGGLFGGLLAEKGVCRPGRPYKSLSHLRNHLPRISNHPNTTVNGWESKCEVVAEREPREALRIGSVIGGSPQPILGFASFSKSLL